MQWHSSVVKAYIVLFSTMLQTDRGFKQTCFSHLENSLFPAFSLSCLVRAEALYQFVSFCWEGCNFIVPLREHWLCWSLPQALERGLLVLWEAVLRKPECPTAELRVPGAWEVTMHSG